MKHFKKVIVAFLSSAVLFTGCLNTEETAHVTEDTGILTSFYPIYMFTQEVVKDTSIKVTNMTNTQTGCLHDYQLTTDDMKNILDCKIFIINGSGMENSFIANAMEQNPHIHIIDSGFGVHTLFNDGHLHKNDHEHGHSNNHDHDHDHDHDHNEINPHTWLSTTNAKIQVMNIASELIRFYPEYSEILMKNADDYCKFIDSSLVFTIENNNNLKAVSFHEGFAYLANDIGFTVEKSVTVEESHLPSAKELEELSVLCNSGKISFIICADDEGKRYAELLASETGLPIVILDPFVSYGDYIQIQAQNYENLKVVLSIG